MIALNTVVGENSHDLYSAADDTSKAQWHKVVHGTLRCVCVCVCVCVCDTDFLASSPAGVMAEHASVELSQTQSALLVFLFKCLTDAKPSSASSQPNDKNAAWTQWTRNCPPPFTDPVLVSFLVHEHEYIKGPYLVPIISVGDAKFAFHDRTEKKPTAVTRVAEGLRYSSTPLKLAVDAADGGTFELPERKLDPVDPYEPLTHSQKLSVFTCLAKYAAANTVRSRNLLAILTETCGTILKQGVSMLAALKHIAALFKFEPSLTVSITSPQTPQTPPQTAWYCLYPATNPTDGILHSKVDETATADITAAVGSGFVTFNIDTLTLLPPKETVRPSSVA